MLLRQRRMKVKSPPIPPNVDLTTEVVSVQTPIPTDLTPEDASDSTDGSYEVETVDAKKPAPHITVTLSRRIPFRLQHRKPTPRHRSHSQGQVLPGSSQRLLDGKGASSLSVSRSGEWAPEDESAESRVTSSTRSDDPTVESSPKSPSPAPTTATSGSSSTPHERSPKPGCSSSSRRQTEATQ